MGANEQYIIRTTSGRPYGELSPDMEYPYHIDAIYLGYHADEGGEQLRFYVTVDDREEATSNA